MFEIRRDIGPFEECELIDHDANSRVQVFPGRGGIITSFTVGGKELFYLEKETILDTTRSVRGGNPILFPLCGGLPEDTYQFKDAAYKIKQHGFGRTNTWKVTGSDTNNAATLTIELSSDETTLASFPFHFTVKYHYILKGNTLTIRQEYINRGYLHDPEVAMPFATGFHPYFLAKDKSQLQFDLPASQYVDHVTGEPSAFQGFPFEEQVIDWVFTDVHSPIATVTNPTDGYRLTLKSENVYKYLVFWTLAGKDFFCLEPWTARRNALNTGTDLQHVPPRSSLTFEFSMVGELL
jgi:galactose mutarotase-like enzyme